MVLSHLPDPITHLKGTNSAEFALSLMVVTAIAALTLQYEASCAKSELSAERGDHSAYCGSISWESSRSRLSRVLSMVFGP